MEKNWTIPDGAPHGGYFEPDGTYIGPDGRSYGKGKSMGFEFMELELDYV